MNEGKRRYAQHPSPGLIADSRQQGIGKIRDQDAEDDVELEHTRRDARDSAEAKFPRCRGVHATVETPIPMPPSTRAMRNPYTSVASADHIEPIRYSTPIKNSVFRRPRRSDAKPPDMAPSTVPYSADAIAMPCMPASQMPEGLNFLFGARDHDRVESKQKPRQRGDHRPKQNAVVHGLFVLFLAGLPRCLWDGRSGEILGAQESRMRNRGSSVIVFGTERFAALRCETRSRS